MPSICLCINAHQPIRLRRYTFFDINSIHDYEDCEKNRLWLDKIADASYLPANAFLLELIKKHKGAFVVSFCLSGVLLDQLEQFRPDVLESFVKLAKTGCVEFLCETSHRSLAFVKSKREFREQVQAHRDRIQALFGQFPSAFRLQELAFCAELAKEVERIGFSTLLVDCPEQALGWRTPNLLYLPKGCMRLKCLFRNNRLSDDLSFRFNNRDWPDYPLTPEKFVSWVRNIGTAEVVNIFADYEQFGNAQSHGAGVSEFMARLPGELARHSGMGFTTPSALAAAVPAADQIDIHAPGTKPAPDRCLPLWFDNNLQNDALNTLFSLETKVRRNRDPGVLATWRRLQMAEHFKYMSTSLSADVDYHRFQNPYTTQHDAYINFMNVINDFSNCLE